MIAGVASALGPMGVLVALHQSLCDVLENPLGSMAQDVFRTLTPHGDGTVALLVQR